MKKLLNVYIPSQMFCGVKFKNLAIMNMPTIKREWYPGASYHVTARDNHRNDIFKDEGDFLYYLTLMKETLDYYTYDKYEIISYCLMDNHVHILIKTAEKPLGQFIGKLSSKYAKYYNKKYNYIGLIKEAVEFLENQYEILSYCLLFMKDRKVLE